MMKVMSRKTNKKSDEVMKRAKDYFGSFGLEVNSETPGCCLELTSELGFVTVEVFEDGDHNEVKLTTREFERQIEEFLAKKL